MSIQLLLNSELHTWVVLPVLIFLARVVDVSIGTARVIFVSKGLKYLAAFMGFFEVLVWLLAIGQIMKNLANPLCYIAYAGGFATGNIVGVYIAEKMSVGMVLVRIITSKDASELVGFLQSSNYGVTSIEGHGSSGQVQVVFTIVPRREVESIVDLIKRFNPNAFYSIEEVGFVEKGIFPAKKAFTGFSLEKIFRPFRKGK